MNFYLLIGIAAVIILAVLMIIRYYVLKGRKFNLFNNSNMALGGFWGRVRMSLSFTGNRENKNQPEYSGYSKGGADSKQLMQETQVTTQDKVKKKRKKYRKRVKKMAIETKETKKEEEPEETKIEENKEIKPRKVQVVDIFEAVKDNQELVDVLTEIKNRRPDLFSKIVRLKRDEDLQEAVKESIVEFLKEEIVAIKDKLSDLRREGKDLKTIDLRTMKISNKIGTLSAYFSRKEFTKIIDSMEILEKELVTI
jgi:hypothetical protein